MSATSPDRVPLPVVHLDATPAAGDVATGDLRVTIGGEEMHFALAVPDGPARVGELLPVFRGLAEVVVGVGVRAAERAGKRVSCRAGCGACCRQPVPVSESEAHALRRLVGAMPEPRQTLVRERFAAAVRKLTDAGLVGRLLDPPPGDTQAVGLDYFRLDIPCPFLDDESCSIHPDRPIACREYLVTSPAEACGRPADGQIDGVTLPAAVGRAVRAVDAQAGGSAGWVPLVLALDWAEAHPEPPPNVTGPDLFWKFWAAFSGEDVRPKA